MINALKALLFFLIVGAGIGIYLYLEATRPAARKRSSKPRPTLVTVIPATLAQEPLTVLARGIVVPAQSVTIYPEVSGRIVFQSPSLVPGGRFVKGQVLVRIDPTDYELALKQQQAAVVKAKMALMQERGQKAVAEHEWKMLSGNVHSSAEAKKLVLREVQLENAQAELDAALGALEQARLRCKRTVIRAPFSSVVTEELVDVGQVVSTTSHIATLVARDRFWVQVSLPLDRLGQIDIPGINSEKGSLARVVQVAGESLRIQREGRVIRLLHDLDPKGKMVRLLVEVADPLGTSRGNGLAMPLLLGGNVNVHIQGPRVRDALALPRLALRERDRVWVMNRDRRLEIRQVEVVWSNSQTVFVRGNLRPGERVITSRIAAPVQNMLLDIVRDERSKSSGTAVEDKPAAPAPPGGHGKG